MYRDAKSIRTTGAGIGALALAGMLAGQSRSADNARAGAGPLAPKAPHFAAKAKRIIFLFLEGAFSQLDTWEYKPRASNAHAEGKRGLAAERWSLPSLSLPSTVKPNLGLVVFQTAHDMWTSSVSCVACIPIRLRTRRQSFSCIQVQPMPP